MIIEAIQRYYPEWDPPADYREWNRCLCPFHGETVASAAVSYDLDAFNCFGCDVRGDAISIIQHMEEVKFAEAKSIAEGLSDGSNTPVQGKRGRKPSRRVFGEPGDTGRKRVRPGIRERAAPWT